MSNIITAPQATSPLSVWLSYLEHLHSSAIDMGLERVGKVGQLLNVLRPAPKVITVSGTNGKGNHLPYARVNFDGFRIESGGL